MAPREERHRKRLSPGQPRARFVTSLFHARREGVGKNTYARHPPFPLCFSRLHTAIVMKFTIFIETVASFLEFFRPRTGLMQGLRGLCAIGRLLIPLHVQGDTLANVFSRPH